MGRGGKRPGAGRKAGVPSTKTVARQEVVEKALAEGVTPLQVMLDNMRFYHEAGQKALEQLLTGAATPQDIVEQHDPKQIDPEKPPPSMMEAFKVMLALRDKAGEAAKDAAPYCHSRLAAVEGNKKPDDETVPLNERLAEYDREEAIEASAGKVVTLSAKKKGGK